MLFEDPRDSTVLGGHQTVSVGEAETILLCDSLAQGGFSGPHRPNQDNGHDD
jgi:hypothetical protein